ncbi:MAG: Rpn family recombination-promoting nuclease/putative transposase [Muribaculum sp.]|nr:Rpn family recombination-promoting nuclease/putative transposase [Muribaculum sp.]MCM1142016.1 Rpn family recombination-promoting nuclease/putative transposase [Muribaculum sp.]
MVDVKFHNKEVLPPNPDGKKIVYDVYCTSPEEKEHFILEMQQEHHLHFDKRVMYYLSKALAGQGKKGKNYDYSPVYGIFFVNFQFKHLERRIIHDFEMREKETHQPFSNLMRLLVVCLEEVRPSWGECNTEFEKITYLIKNMHNMDKKSEAYKSKEYKDMFDAAEIDSFAAEDVVAYSQSVRAYEDRELYRDSGYIDGYEEGTEEGIEQGIEKGLQISARKMLDSGITPDFILQITGLAPGQY